MARRSKPPIWGTIRAGYASAAEQFRALGSATVIAVVLVAILQLIRVPTQESVLAIVRPVLVSLASAIVLSPYAVLVHRRILLGIDDRSYWTTFSAPRTLAFTSAAIGLGLLSEVGLMALLVGIRPPEPRVVLILLGMAWIIVALGFFCRAALVFPIIAVDGSTTPWRDSLRLTQGNAWRIFWIIMVSVLPLLLALLVVSNGVYWLLGTPDDSWLAWSTARLGSAIFSTFQYALLVSILSCLYQTRTTWANADGQG